MSFSGKAARGHADRRAAGRHHLRQAVLRDDQGREERGQGRRRPSRWSRRSASRSRSTRSDAQGHREEGDQGRQGRSRRRRRRSRKPEPTPKQAQEAGRRRRRSDRRDLEEGSREAAEEGRAAASQQPKFDPTRSRRCSTSAIRSARPRPATELNPTPSLGTSTGNAANCRRARSTRCARG